MRTPGSTNCDQAIWTTAGRPSARSTFCQRILHFERPNTSQILKFFTPVKRSAGCFKVFGLKSPLTTSWYEYCSIFGQLPENRRGFVARR